MRIFNNIQDFWDYTLYCPICEDFCRTISFNLYPDELFKPDSSYNTIGNDLIINFITRNTLIYPNFSVNGKLVLNFTTNEFNFISSESLDKSIKDFIKRSKYYKLELFIQSCCEKCNSSVMSTDDIELNLFSKKIKEIAIYSEEITLKIDSSEIYNIFQNYKENKTVISILHTLDDGSLRQKSSYQNSLLKIDFSELKKIYPRIKTILTFS